MQVTRARRSSLFLFVLLLFQNIARMPLFYTVFVVLLLNSCSFEYSIKAEKLFSIPFGNMPGNFNPWYRGISPNPNVSFTVHNGIFYIGNGTNLSVFSSSGVLLEYIAPPYGPANQQGHLEAYQKNNIPYYAYPLEYVGAIGVVENKKIFFANLALSTIEGFFQSEKSTAAVQLLLYENKRIEQSIGEDGPNSSNFYSIKKIFTRKNSDIVVYSIEKDAHVLYFFDKNNYFRYKLVVSEEQLPIFQGKPQVEIAGTTVKTQGLLANVVPSLKKPYVYVQVRYYDFVSDLLDSVLEVRFNSMKVFRIDIRTHSYDKEMMLSEVSESLLLQSVLYDENLLFMGSVVPDDASSSSAITVLKTNQYGFITRSYELTVPFEDFVWRAIDYDDESRKVAAYYVRDDNVSVVWWRTKRL